MKPLFIPLKGVFYDAIKAGVKTNELRKYGPRWNENTCAIGREVVLSRGYGKANRMRRRIVSFDRLRMEDLAVPDYVDARSIYGHGIEIAVIGLERKGQS